MTEAVTSTDGLAAIPILLIGGTGDERDAVADRLAHWGARCPHSEIDTAEHGFDAKLDLLRRLALPEDTARLELFYLIERYRHGGHGLVLARDDTADLIGHFRGLKEDGLLDPRVLVLDDAAWPELNDLEPTRISPDALMAMSDAEGQTFLRRLGFTLTRYQIRGALD